MDVNKLFAAGQTVVSKFFNQAEGVVVNAEYEFVRSGRAFATIPVGRAFAPIPAGNIVRGYVTVKFKGVHEVKYSLEAALEDLTVKEIYARW